jgi:hypothetical protein
MRTALITGSLMLSGCASGYHQAMRADMGGLTGKPILTVIDRLGYPAREITIAGDRVYVWDGNGCTLKVGVDSGARVIHAEYEGDHGDCGPYRKALEKS